MHSIHKIFYDFFKLDDSLKFPNGWYRISPCPYCGKKEHAGVKFTNGKYKIAFNCYSKICGETASEYKLAKHLGILTQIQLGKELEKKLPDINFEKQETSEDKYLNVEIKPPLLFKRVYDHWYARERDIKLWQLKKHEFGTSSIEQINRLIILIREDGKLVGYVGRALKNQKPKYLNSSEENEFGNILWGIDEITEKTKRVLLVEGPTSKLRVEQFIDNKKTVACCTFGKELKRGQYYKLKQKNVKNVILMYDDDATKSIIKNSQKLIKDFNCKVSVIKDGDPGDFNKESFINVIKNNTFDAMEYYTGNKSLIKPKF